MNMPVSPGARDEAWSTPAAAPLPVTSPIVPTHEVAGISPIYAGGAADAGGRDDVAGTVAGSVAAAQGRYHEHQTDTYGQGSVIGDLMALPPVPGEHSKHAGGDDAGYPS